MKYQEFTCAIEKEVRQKLNKDIRVTLHSVMKNNSRERIGLVIKEPDVMAAPTIYLEEFYEKYQKEKVFKTLEAIACDILNYYRSVRCEISQDFNKLGDFKNVRDRILYKLINTEKNGELLKSIPHRKIVDLSIAYYVLLEMNELGTGTILIDHEQIQRWGVGEAQLFELANANSHNLLPVQLMTIKSVVKELTEPLEEVQENLLRRFCSNAPGDTADWTSDNDERADIMYVLTNRNRSLGAACILYPQVLDQIRLYLKENYYILPSSIHEVIIVPESKCLEKSEMDKIITEINAAHVADEEVLSDHSYYYNPSGLW